MSRNRARLIVWTMFLVPRLASAGPLTLYSRLAGAPATVKAFAAQTGIEIRLRRPPPAGIVARIVAEKSDPHWSLAWFDGASTAIMLAPEIQGRFVTTGSSTAGVILMAKSAPFAPPTTWHALNDPPYHGLIGMNDPQTSDQCYSTIAALLQSAGGWPAGQSFFIALKRHGLHIYADSRTTIAALRSGAIQIAIVPSPQAIRAVRTDPSLRIVIPHPAARQQQVIVMAKSLHGTARADAERFIAFVKAREPKKKFATPPLDPHLWGDVQTTVTAWFVAHVVGHST